jgi:DNA-binding transcriptional LysR family regulator
MAMSPHGRCSRERFEIDSIEAIAVMVDRGLGVSLLPDWARPWSRRASLATIPYQYRIVHMQGASA